SGYDLEPGPYAVRRCRDDIAFCPFCGAKLNQHAALTRAGCINAGFSHKFPPSFRARLRSGRLRLFANGRGDCEPLVDLVLSGNCYGRKWRTPTRSSAKPSPTPTSWRSSVAAAWV